MQGNAPDEEYEYPHGECSHEIERLRNALKNMALVNRYSPAKGGGMNFVGKMCEICDAEVDGDAPLIHVGDCPLTVLNPST